MSRVILYHRTEFPMGKVFDRETNKPDPHVSTAPFGTVDHPDKLSLTQDDLIEALVKQELASKIPERSELEGEYSKATGDSPHFAAKDDTLIKTLDDPKARKTKRK